MSSIWSWSTTADNNGTADDSINWAEGMAPSAVNNSAREMMARVRELLDDLGGITASTNTANAYSLTATSAFAALADGLRVSFRASATNTGSATLAVNSLTAKPIKKISTAGEVDVAAGEIQSSGIYEFVYSTALNAGNGAWLLLNPSSSLASGIIAMWSGAANAIPSGWLLCDGTNSTPDLRDKFIVGAGDTYAVGDTGGAATVTLTEAQLPTITPTFTGNAVPDHTHTVPFGSGSAGSGTWSNAQTGTGVDHTVTSNAAGGHTPSGTISSFGSGDSHENLPPYYALCFIQKA